MSQQADASQQVNVLLVEDSRTQAMLTEYVLSEIPQMHLMATLDDGEKAVQFLWREGEYAEVVRPNLVLLDINLPGMSGFDVLHRMKADPELCTIPVVMLTASSDEQDVAKSYASGASTFITKPVQPDDFKNVIEQFASYWSSAAQLPPNA